MSWSVWADNSGYKCVGTEPFFNLEISKSVLNLRTGYLDESYSVDGPIAARGTNSDFVSVFKSKDHDTVVSIVRGECSDGMSDDIYPYHMVYSQADNALYGCCVPVAGH